eukprot:g7256.t1
MLNSINSENCPTLKLCNHQVAGHLPEDGKGGSLIDEQGKFYKPLQSDLRGITELNFYNKVFSNKIIHLEDRNEVDVKAELHEFVSRFFGTISIAGKPYLILQDAVYGYEKPCIMDVKIGYRTWYSTASEEYKEKAKKKDSLSTQGTLGFRICGWQTYNKTEMKFHRMSKHECKTLKENLICETLIKFADNTSGLNLREVYYGAICKVKELYNWCQRQEMFNFYSSSILLIYEGEAESEKELRVQIKLIDFAHAYPIANGIKDTNFQDGLMSFIHWLELAAANDCR